MYSILIDKLPENTFVCSSGQFTYAVWLLLEKLVESNCQIYYVGDLNLEGLLMAQRLLNRFPNFVQTIGMTLLNYEKAKVQTEISDNRLKQLRALKDPNLQKIALKIEKNQEIAMQEGFISELIEAIREKNNDLNDRLRD